jgi:hypothetical protein
VIRSSSPHQPPRSCGHDFSRLRPAGHGSGSRCQLLPHASALSPENLDGNRSLPWCLSMIFTARMCRPPLATTLGRGWLGVAPPTRSPKPRAWGGDEVGAAGQLERCLTGARRRSASSRSRSPRGHPEGPRLRRAAVSRARWPTSPPPGPSSRPCRERGRRLSEPQHDSGLIVDRGESDVGTGPEGRSPAAPAVLSGRPPPAPRSCPARLMSATSVGLSTPPQPWPKHVTAPLEQASSHPAR